MVQPQRAGSSCAIHRGVERPVQACPQALHNGACPRGEDCGMAGMLAFVSAALALTSLPPLPGAHPTPAHRVRPHDRDCEAERGAARCRPCTTRRRPLGLGRVRAAWRPDPRAMVSGVRGARTRLASERRGRDPLSERSVRRLDPRTRHVCGAPPRQAAPHPAHAALRAVPDVERLVGLPRRYERVRSNPVSQDGRASRARAALYAAPPSRRLSLAAVRRPCRRRPRGRTRRPPARRRRRRVTAGARRSR